MTGRIKLLNEKRFGFITPDKGKKDVFFHTSALVNAEWNALQKGDKVEFETQEAEKGLKAINVRLMGR